MNPKIPTDRGLLALSRRICDIDCPNSCSCCIPSYPCTAPSFALPASRHASVVLDQILALSESISVEIVDTKTNSILSSLKGHPGGAMASTFLPQSNVLAVACYVQNVFLWPLRAEELSESEGSKKTVMASGWPQRRHSDLVETDLLFEFSGPSYNNFTVSSDKNWPNLVFLGCSVGAAQVYDVKAKKELAVLRGGGKGEVYGVKLNDTGDLIATAGLTSVNLWDSRTFRPIHPNIPFIGPTQSSSDAFWSHTRTNLLVLSETSGRIMILDVRNPSEPYANWEGHTNESSYGRNCEIDENRFATTSWDRTCRVWTYEGKQLHRLGLTSLETGVCWIPVQDDEGNSPCEREFQDTLIWLRGSTENVLLIRLVLGDGRLLMSPQWFGTAG